MEYRPDPPLRLQAKDPARTTLPEKADSVTDKKSTTFSAENESAIRSLDKIGSDTQSVVDSIGAGIENARVQSIAQAAQM